MMARQKNRISGEKPGISFVKVKRKISKKLRSRSGESIAETLVALLISSLALIMLAEAMSASSGVITKSRNQLKAYNQGEEAMVHASGTANPGEIRITTEPSDTTLNIPSYSVNYYTNSVFGKTPVVEYKYRVTGSPGGG